jgi:hypothetical protein
MVSTSAVVAEERRAAAPMLQAARIHWSQYRILLGATVGLGAMDGVWLSFSGLAISPGPALLRLGIALLLLIGAAAYGLTGRSERISATLLSAGTLLLFTFFGVILNYLAIRAGWPLADDLLASWDRALGLDWPAYEQLIAGHAWIAAITRVLYGTSVIQILVTILVLGFSARLDVLAEFTAGLIIVALITVVVGALLPALGAHHHYGMPDHGAAFFIREIVAAHSGSLHVLNLSAAEGLVTFPSFHTAISVAVVIACWSVSYLRYPTLAANLVLVAGVPVWGSHYFVDVAAGAILTVVAVLAWRRMFRAPEIETYSTRATSAV